MAGPALCLQTLSGSTARSLPFGFCRQGRERREVSQPLAPCSQTAIANAITPARPKRREIPRQTKLSLLPCLTSGQLLPLK